MLAPRLLLALALCLVSALALARGGLPSNNPTLNAGITCTTYLGLGDVQPGAAFYVGMRAWTHAAALAGAKDFQLRRASDNAVLDVNLACNGLPNISQTVPFCNGTSCFVAKYYDQTGNGWDMPQATTGNQGLYVFSCANGNPCMTNAVAYGSALANTTFDQPNTFWAVESGFNSFNASSNIAGCLASGNQEALYSKNFGGTTNTFVMQDNGGTSFTGGTAVVGIFQDKLAVFNGGSSTLYVSASPTSGALSGTTCTSTTNEFYAAGESGQFLEAAGYVSDVSGNVVAMRANARTVWNY